MAWLEHHVMQAAKMWNEGATGTEIAKAFGVSRNAVLGLANRNKHYFAAKVDFSSGTRVLIDEYKRSLPGPKKEAKPRRPRASRAKVAKVITPAPTQDNIPVEVRIPPKLYDIERRPYAKELTPLGCRECKWPVDEHPFRFCADEIVQGKPYCAHHLERSRGRTMQRAQA